MEKFANVIENFRSCEMSFAEFYETVNPDMDYYTGPMLLQPSVAEWVCAFSRIHRESKTYMSEDILLFFSFVGNLKGEKDYSNRIAYAMQYFHPKGNLSERIILGSLEFTETIKNVSFANYLITL